MAAAPVTAEFAQQPPPRGGYSVDHFRQQLDGMARHLRQMLAAGDPRAVFQCTYLAFSRQVLAALEADRFHERAWATDMCCRFVDAYLEQLRRWEHGDPGQCLAWQTAFSAAAAGRRNVLQAMFLGMNAHIHYDLAFVTLGACRHAGDLAMGAAPTRALAASRSGVPLVRYRDFLVINQVAWESIPLIQDEVLRTFNRWLYIGHHAVRQVTHLAGQRVLLAARDASWCQTALLVHARDDAEREVVTRMIDLYAAGVADAIGLLTLRPRDLLRSGVAWLQRGHALPPDLLHGLVELSCGNPVVAELALHQLAVMGADPVRVVGQFVGRGELRLAAAFVHEVIRYGPLRRRSELHRFLRGGSDGGVAVVETQFELGMPRRKLPRGASVRRVAARWCALRERTRAALALPDAAGDELLAAALTDSLRRLETGIARLPATCLRTAQGWGATDERRDGHARFLLEHPDSWVRLCARRVLHTIGDEGEDMSRLIDRVLFLKQTRIFLEVEPPVLLGVAEQLQRRSFGRGALLVRDGEQGIGVHLVRSGRVEVLQRRGEDRLRVAVLGPHDAVGELSALNETPATADCRALTAVESYFLPNDVLAHLLHQHPRLAIGVIRMLSQRLIETTQRIDAAAEPQMREPP